MWALKTRQVPAGSRIMKLIIQIPCYNEAETLPVTIRALPRTLTGIDVVEYLVIDNGSTDRTLEVAHQAGVQPYHPSAVRSLAGAFVAGIEACLERGADIIVNTDADNQYNADDIQRFGRANPGGRAQLVVGDRGVSTQRIQPLQTAAATPGEPGNCAGLWHRYSRCNQRVPGDRS